MSLNSITLPAQLVADLYQHSLVKGHQASVPKPKPVAFLGKNSKQILLVMNQPEVPFLPDSELAFLTTVLAACGLDLSAVAIVNQAQEDVKNGAAVLEQLTPNKVILFDAEADAFGFPASPTYSIQTTGSLQFATAPSLTQIEQTKEAKRDFWLMLKQLFGL